MALTRTPTDMIIDRASGQKLSDTLAGIPVNVKIFGAKGDKVTDDTASIQSGIDYLMTRGGGTLYFPTGDYLINGTLYTHKDTYDIDDIKSPITFVGSTPVNADLYNSKKKNITRLIKLNAGTILGVNYTPTQECVYPSVYRNLTIKNIGFYGSVVSYDSKYTKVAASVTATDAIEMRNAAINLQDCIFWSLRKGVSQPDTVLGVDNYCDQSTYRNLGFFNMGDTWLQLQRPDASAIDNIYGYDNAKTCVYGVYVRKAESLEVGKVLGAGKGMHLCPNFKLINLNRVGSANIKAMYGERIEGLLVNTENGCKNIEVGEVGVRHYGKTYIKARDTRNITVKSITAWVEEGKVLSASDPGDYSVYDTITLPNEIDVDITCYNVRIGKMNLRNGVHSGGSFSETTLRTEPRMPKTAKASYGTDDYVLTIYHNGTSIVARVHGIDLDWTEFCGGVPTFNGSNGELTFPATGIFGNQPSAVATGRKHPTTAVRNVPFIISNNPLKLELLTTGFAPVTLNDVALTLQVKY